MKIKEKEPTVDLRVNLAFMIMKFAVEGDEGTLSISPDNFDVLFQNDDYPYEQIHRFLNLNQKMIAGVIKRKPDGRTAKVVKKSIDYITNPKGSHCYSRGTAEGIYGVSGLIKDE